MREMKNSGIEWIGNIPSDWGIIPHKVVMHKQKDICEHYNGEDIISLTMGGVVVRDLTAGGKMPTTFDGYQYVEEDDLLLCLFDIDVTPRCVGVVKNNGITSPAYSRFKVHNGFYNCYYDYLLRAIDNDKVFVHLSKNLRSSLTETDFGAIKTIAPSYEEQKKIAVFLDERCAEIDSVIEKTKATIEEYKKLKQSVITQAVTKGIRPNRTMKDSGSEWLGNIPSEWSILKVKYLGWTQNGISKSGEHFGFGFPFVSYSDVYKNFELPQNVNGLINSTPEEQENYSVEKGDIFFTRTSETIEEVGFSSVCKKTIPNAVFAGFLIRLRVISPEIHIDYAKYYFRGEQIRRYLIKQMNLVTRASLGQDLLRAMSVTIPSIDEQKEIVEYLDKKCSEIDELIVKKTSLLSELESYKKSLIYEYVTGKKEV